MNRRNFTRLVERALAGIPAPFLQRVENLTLQVEQWADAATLAEVGCSDPRQLLGFYRGWPVTERNHGHDGLPDVIVIYQGAVERQAFASRQGVLRVIRETLVHELAHHFGFSEAQMEEIEGLWAAGRQEEP